MAIKSFRNKALQKFFETGSTKGINAQQAPKLKRILDKLDNAICPEDMNLPNYSLHKLEPKTAGRWAVSVNGPWRVTFEFEGEDAKVVDYEQYH
jgi:proteic killer suppression protein